MKSDKGPAVELERIKQYAWGYAAPLILEAAIKHQVFDLLDAGPKTAEQLAGSCAASVRGLRMIGNALVGLGLLSVDRAGCYSLTPESAAYLVSSKPGYLGGFLRHGSTQLIPRWLQLAEIVRTGKPAMSVNKQEEGTRFFQEFVEDLFPFNHGSAQVLADALDIARSPKPVSVLDLAAGSGVWSIALAEKSPQVRVTAVDWPGVIDVTRRVASRHGLADRYRFVAGDLLDADFGQGHDIATLGHILHSEGETRSRSLLKKTFAALAPGGVAAIAEWLVNDDRTGPPAALIFAVNMLVNTDLGDTFSFNEIRRWLEEAGFTQVRTIDCPGPSPLILANKPAR